MAFSSPEPQESDRGDQLILFSPLARHEPGSPETSLVSNSSLARRRSSDFLHTSDNRNDVPRMSLHLDGLEKHHLKAVANEEVVSRGRSSQRMSTPASLVNRADSRHHRESITVEVNLNRIQTRASRSRGNFYGNQCITLGDLPLGHCAHDPICVGVPEVLQTPSKGFETGVQTYSQLPSEIMGQIYFNLAPVDYNSARHTCRSWYISSLERSLLKTMLNRSGWSTSIIPEFVLNNARNLPVRASHEWLMSKFIARECALGPDWTGNGLSPSKETQMGGFSGIESKQTPLVHNSMTCFTESEIYQPSTDGSNSGLVFTVSSCGKFLMMAHGCVVYVYELDGNNDEDLGECASLRPVTSVICPRRVLACSMDTSSRRYAIAVLLDGRMGLVCDLTDVRNCRRRSSSLRSQKYLEKLRHKEHDYRNRVSISSSRVCGPCRAHTEQPFVFPVIAAEASQSNLTDEQVTADSDAPEKFVEFDSRTFSTNQHGSPRPPFSISLNPMPIEPSSPTLYAPLCSADDPPRSVALCPQRRCVAFGCSSGIELHWVDALTGQDLSRWFPLTAPSDYLYFLPPRAGVDSAKKLRLISSAGRPGERPVIADRFGATRTRPSTTHRARSNSFWGISSGRSIVEWDPSQLTSSTNTSKANSDNSDHYHAVPLSDGYHILFTDPGTGFLCLGSDAPIGGPTKLLRKIWFTGPRNEGSPVAYAAGSYIKNGVRVVAAYGQGPEQNIWLFSVPSDIFSESQFEKAVNTPFSTVRARARTGNREWIKWWCDAGISESSSPVPVIEGSTVREDRLWPVRLRGQKIGKFYGLVDLVIDAEIMTIWAFGSDGMIKTWQFDNGSLDGRRKKFTFMRDGAIREGSASGDVQMVDVPSSSYECRHQETFDGSTSMTDSSILVLGGQSYVDYRASSHRHGGDSDADGDILMADLPDVDMELSDYDSDGSFETIALAHGSYEDVYHHEYLSGPSYVEQLALQGQDWVHLLTGIARIEVEIH